jgi:hypothetical protein
MSVASTSPIGTVVNGAQTPSGRRSKYSAVPSAAKRSPSRCKLSWLMGPIASPWHYANATDSVLQRAGISRSFRIHYADASLAPNLGT